MKVVTQLTGRFITVLCRKWLQHFPFSSQQYHSVIAKKKHNQAREGRKKKLQTIKQNKDKAGIKYYIGAPTIDTSLCKDRQRVAFKDPRPRV